MKTIPIVMGYRHLCYHCGSPIRGVYMDLGNGLKWRVCEDFPGTPDAVELHDCPKHPTKRVAREACSSDMSASGGAHR